MGLICCVVVMIGRRMSWIQSGKNRHPEKPVSGCLGRMVNMFDLSNGTGGKKLLTDKPHHDGNFFTSSLLCRLHYVFPFL